jgi:hypothetical protein
MSLDIYAKNWLYRKATIMARPREQYAGRSAEARRRMMPAANKKPTEGQREMVRKEDRKRGDDSPEARLLRSLAQSREDEWDARYVELFRQKIRLRENGAAMTWRTAIDAVDDLRHLQEEHPEAFVALVALVKPRGATRLLDKVPPEGLASLKKSVPYMLDRRGLVKPAYAAVLDAAYEEAGGGVVLRNPVAYTSKFVKKWASVVAEAETRLDLTEDLTTDEAIKALRERRRKGAGPSR